MTGRAPRDTLHRRPHSALCFYHVRDDVRNRTVIAHRARQHHLDLRPDRFIHDPARQHSTLDRLAQAAGAANGIDGAHVVAVPAFDRLPRPQIDAERSAIERGFAIVRRNGIAAKQHLDIPRANQVRERRGGATVHDRGTRDEKNFTLVLLHIAHFSRNLRDDQSLGAFGGNVRIHEGKELAFA